MIHVQLANSDRFCPLGGMDTGIAAKDDDVQQRVAHEAVCGRGCRPRPRRRRRGSPRRSGIRGDVQAAVLVVQGRVDQDGLLAHIDAVLEEHAQHGGNALYDGALAAFELDHRRIQPDRVASGVRTPLPRSEHSG